MAQVVMTDEQKELLIADPNFVTAVKWSILAQADYERGVDGTGVSGAANLKQWAQWRPLAAQIIANPAIINGGAAQFFVNQISVQSLTCWDNVSNLTADAIQWLYGNHGGNSTNYFGANSLAQAWFAQQVLTSPW